MFDFFWAGELGTGSGPIRDAAVSSCPVTYWRDAHAPAGLPLLAAPEHIIVLSCVNMQEGFAPATAVALPLHRLRGARPAQLQQRQDQLKRWLFSKTEKNRHLNDKMSSPELGAGCCAQNVTWVDSLGLGIWLAPWVRLVSISHRCNGSHPADWQRAWRPPTEGSAYTGARVRCYWRRGQPTRLYCQSDGAPFSHSLGATSPYQSLEGFPVRVSAPG